MSNVENTNINREHKDRLFKFIFGNEQNKDWTLALYNAINGSNYTDSDLIEFNTIENVLYMSMKKWCIISYFWQYEFFRASVYVQPKYPDKNIYLRRNGLQQIHRSICRFQSLQQNHTEVSCSTVYLLLQRNRQEKGHYRPETFWLFYRSEKKQYWSYC